MDGKGPLMKGPVDRDAAGHITEILAAVNEGGRPDFDRLFPLVYEQLRRIAARQLRREHPGHTLVATALVHEAYLKLADHARVTWQGRAHFFAIAARAMRQILVDHARKKSAGKRGGDCRRTTLGDEGFGRDLSPEDLLALDQALERLAALKQRLTQIVELRFFGGMTEKEVAEALGVPKRTIQRDWARARAWLYKELYQGKD